MRIRLKLTLLLLLFGLAPLLTVELLDAFAFTRLRGRVEGQITDNISRRVEQELLVHVERTAEQMRGIRNRMMMMTRTQSAVFADAFASEAPGSAARVLTLADLADLRPGEIPPGFREQPGWPRDAGPSRAVTYEAGVLVTPGGSAAEPDTVARLASVTDELNALSLDLRPSIRAQYIGLEDGTHFSFPGKPGYNDYDPRSRDWYTRAASGENETDPGITWTGPYRDAITGEPRLTASSPVRAPDGTLIGVTGVDLALSRAIDILELPAELALGSAAWVVVIEDSAQQAKDPMPRVLLSTRDGVLQPGSTDPDDPRLNSIIDALREGRTGSESIEVDGQAGLAAFGPIGGESGLVMFVPEHRIESLVGGVRQDLRSIARESFRILLASSFLVVLLCLLGAYLMGRTVSRPIRRLADAATAVSAGDLSARVAVRNRRDEIGKLSRAFNEMVPALADRMRLQESMALANELQQGLLPSETPGIPGFDVFGIAVYCDETGGDYFDYLQPIDLGADRYGLALGDVTGHGIPAALIMTSARALLQSHAKYVDRPDEILARMNETIARESSHGKFMTFMLLVLDPVRGSLEVANAGHDPALLYRADAGTFEELALGGLPLGIVADETYETVRTDLPSPGDIVVLGTDGIWETRDPHGELFGKQRLRETIRAHAGEPAETIGRAVLDDVKAFRGSAPVLDDITFIIAKRESIIAGQSRD